jgi:hypothetical protein
MPLAAVVLSEDLIRAAAASAPVTASSRTDDIPPSWDERTVLTTMLDYVRDTVQVKCAGLSDEQGRRAPLPGSPLTTISSLVSHPASLARCAGISEARLCGRKAERFRMCPPVVLGQHFAGLAGLVRDGAVADLAARDRKVRNRHGEAAGA